MFFGGGRRARIGGERALSFLRLAAGAAKMAQSRRLAFLRPESLEALVRRTYQPRRQAPPTLSHSLFSLQSAQDFGPSISTLPRTTDGRRHETRRRFFDTHVR